MASTFSPNKNLELPANGDYQNDWNVPINADIDAIDTALGGNVSVDVTSFPPGTYPLDVAHYRAPNLIYTGTMPGALNAQLPAGVGGIWTIFNATTGASSLTFSVSGGGSLVLPQGQRVSVVSDGNNLSIISSPPVLSATVTANEGRANTTVPTNSVYLTIPLANGGNYEIVLAIGFEAPSATGIAFNVNYSGSFSSSGFVVLGATGSAGFVSPVVGQMQAASTALQYVVPGNGLIQVLILQGSVNITGPGTLAFAFAQQTSNATPTVIFVGSYLKVTPI